MTVTPHALQSLIFGAALLTLMGSKALLTALEVREMMPISRLSITQRKRYGWVLMGLVMMTSLPIAAVIIYGANTYWLGITEFWSGSSPVGKVVAAVNMVAIAGPALAGLTAWRVYCNPAVLAHWSYSARGYIYADDVRAGIRNPRRAWVYKLVDNTDPQRPIVRKEYRDDT